jgi:HSP20 family protein
VSHFTAGTLLKVLTSKNKRTNMNLVRFQNREFPKLVNAFFDDFDQLVTGNLFNSGVGRTNVRETEKTYEIEVLMPGASKENINIDITDDVLKVSYSNKIESKTENEKYLRQEWGYTNFNKEFLLPENVDRENINASYKDGVLSLSVNKVPQPAKLLRKIEVQ